MLLSEYHLKPVKRKKKKKPSGWNVFFFSFVDSKSGFEFTCSSPNIRPYQFKADWLACTFSFSVGNQKFKCLEAWQHEELMKSDIGPVLQKSSKIPTLGWTVMVRDSISYCTVHQFQGDKQKIACSVFFLFFLDV